jgi:hypothetical protein
MHIGKIELIGVAAVLWKLHSHSCTIRSDSKKEPTFSFYFELQPSAAITRIWLFLVVLITKSVVYFRISLQVL